MAVPGSHVPAYVLTRTHKPTHPYTSYLIHYLCISIITNVLCSHDDSNGSMFVPVDELGPSSKHVCVCVCVCVGTVRVCVAD